MGEPNKTAEVIDLSVWREASYREREKLARTTQKDLYKKPSGRTLEDGIWTVYGNLDRLTKRLACGTMTGIPAAQALRTISDDLNGLSLRAEQLERKLAEMRRKPKRTE